MGPRRSTSPVEGNDAPSAPARLSTSSSTERAWSGRCSVTRTEAGNFAGKFFARNSSASTPPAEVPMATMSRLAIQKTRDENAAAKTARTRIWFRDARRCRAASRFEACWFRHHSENIPLGARTDQAHTRRITGSGPIRWRRWLRDRSRSRLTMGEARMADDLVRQHLLEQIALAERHLVQTDAQIAEQRRRIVWQERMGHDSARAKELLQTYINVRAGQIAHHDRLILELGGHNSARALS